MNAQRERLRKLLKRRSIGGWLLCILGFAWRRLSDWQSVEWLGQHLVPASWLRRILGFHPDYVSVGLVILGLAWFTVIIVWPKEKEAVSGMSATEDLPGFHKLRVGLRDLKVVEIIDRGSGEQRKAAAEALKLKDSDPLIYVDVLDRTAEMARRTPFVLHNRGKSVAHKIQIKTLTLGVGTATFREIDNLDSGGKIEVLPEIPLASIFKYDIFNLLHHEANRIGEGSAKEFSNQMSATYCDVTGQRKFETSFLLVYSPLNKMLFENHPLQKEVKQICEVRDTQIRVVEKRTNG